MQQNRRRGSPNHSSSENEEQNHAKSQYLPVIQLVIQNTYNCFLAVLIKCNSSVASIIFVSFRPIAGTAFFKIVIAQRRCSCAVSSVGSLVQQSNASRFILFQLNALQQAIPQIIFRFWNAILNKGFDQFKIQHYRRRLFERRLFKCIFEPFSNNV